MSQTPEVLFSRPGGLHAALIEDDIHDQLAFTRAITASLGEGVCTVDMAGALTFMNPAAEQILGWTEQEMLGRDLHTTIHFQHADGSPFPVEACPLQAVSRSNATCHCDDDMFIRKDGSKTSVAYTAAPLIYRGKTIGAVVTFRSIAEQKRSAEALRHSEEYYRALFENASDTMSIITANGTSRYSSPSVERMLGYTPEERRGNSVMELVHPDDLLAAQSCLAQVLAQHSSTQHVEVRVRHKDGSWRTLDVTARNLLHHPAVRGIVVNARDITVRRAYEEALRRSEETARAVQREAERANQAKSEFLGRVSHEFRTPLTAILGFAQLLQPQIDNPLHKSYIASMREAGEHLLGLINDVLDMSRIEAHQLPLDVQTLDVEPVIHEALELVQPAAMERSIRFNLDLPLPGAWRVVADPTRLKQVLVNLLSNAIKYNRVGGWVMVSGAEIHNRLRIEVRDTGVGIPADKFDQLFVPFERLANSDPATEGIGLGLALSKELIERMGGFIGVQSQVGHGSTFWIELSLA